MQSLRLASQHTEQWRGGQTEDREGQTDISGTPACYGELDVILGWTWPSPFPPRKFPLISQSSYFQECITGGSLWHNVLSLKHPKRLASLIEIPSLSPTLLVALQDYCSSYSSVSKRLNHPLEKATVSQRRRDHLCSFPQETDFLEKNVQVDSFPSLRRSCCFSRGQMGRGVVLYVSRIFVFHINPSSKLCLGGTTENTNSDSSNENNWHLFIEPLHVWHNMLYLDAYTHATHELSDWMVISPCSYSD